MKNKKSFKSVVIGLLSVVMAIAIFSCSPPVVNGGPHPIADDTTAPTITITSPSSSNITINSHSYTVSGTASDDRNTPDVYLKLNNNGYALLTTATTWSSNLSLVEGQNTVSVYATDSAGNVSDIKTVLITANTGEPVITFTSPSGSYTTNGTPILISGVVTTTNVTNYSAITNIQASINGAAYATITNGGSNVVTWSTNIDLTNGVNSISIKAYADNGKENPATTLYITYDTNAPVLTNITPTNNQYIYRNYTLQGDVSDDYSSVSKVYVKLDGGSFGEIAVSSESWLTNFSGLSYGDHTNWVYAEDNIGNISTTNQIAVMVGTKKIVVYDGGDNDQFGCSSAMSDDGNTVIIGAFLDDDKGTDSGSAYWLRTADSGSTWTTNHIFAYDGSSGDNFGYSVAMSDDGNTVIIGSYCDDDKGGNSGAAYWLRTYDSGITWITNKISAYDGVGGEHFGHSVAMSGDGNTVIIGSLYSDEPSDDEGAAYWLRTYDNGITWITNKLIASGGALNLNDYFGWSVAMSDDGNTVIVGAVGYNDNVYQGAAYWLRTTDSGTTWITNKFIADDGAASDNFGNSVAISDDGNTVIIAAYNDDSKGAAYWLRTTNYGTNWTTNKIVAYDGVAGGWFGSSVAMSDDGDTVIVGSYGDISYQGSAYWLRTTDSGITWATNKIVPYDGVVSGYFGHSVAMSANGNAWVVGAVLNKNNGVATGSAYWWGE